MDMAAWGERASGRRPLAWPCRVGESEGARIELRVGHLLAAQAVLDRFMPLKPLQAPPPATSFLGGACNHPTGNAACFAFCFCSACAPSGTTNWVQLAGHYLNPPQRGAVGGASCMNMQHMKVRMVTSQEEGGEDCTPTGTGRRRCHFFDSLHSSSAAHRPLFMALRAFLTWYEQAKSCKGQQSQRTAAVARGAGHGHEPGPAKQVGLRNSLLTKRKMGGLLRPQPC